MVATLLGRANTAGEMTDATSRSGTFPIVGDSIGEAEDRGPEGKTLPRLSPGERGDEKTQDEWATAKEHPSRTTDAASHEIRRQLASHLANLAAVVISTRGKLAMTAALQVIKRELARAHEVLGQSRVDSSYLSVITLVEAALVSMHWRDATDVQLRRLKSALEIGCREKPLEYNEYLQIERSFRGAGLVTMPQVDFVEPDDLHDAVLGDAE